MRKTTILAAIVFGIAGGFSRSSVSEKIDARINDIAHGVSQPRQQWVGKVITLLADIEALQDAKQKMTYFHNVADNLLAIDVSAPDMEDPRSVADIVTGLCRDEIVVRMRLAGGTIEDAWDVLIPMFAWMRTQADKLYGDGKLPKGTTRLNSGGLRTTDHEAYRQYAKRRDAYNLIATNYGSYLNFAEKQFPDPSNGTIDERRIPALKKKIEKFLGRPMRTREQCEKDWYARKSEMRKWPGRSSTVKPAPGVVPEVAVDVELPEDKAKESKR